MLGKIAVSESQIGSNWATTLRTRGPVSRKHTGHQTAVTLIQSRIKQQHVALAISVSLSLCEKEVIFWGERINPNSEQMAHVRQKF